MNELHHAAQEPGHERHRVLRVVLVLSRALSLVFWAMSVGSSIRSIFDSQRNCG